MSSLQAFPSLVSRTLEIEMQANRPLRVDDPGLAWIVETGWIDLFFQEVDASGEPEGPRRHILRATAGQPLFGMPLASTGLRAVMLAVGAPGTRLRQVALEIVREPDPDGNPSPTALSLVQLWIDLLSKVAAPDVPPRIYFPLTPGKVVKVPPTRPSVCAGREIVWVRHKTGSSYYLGLNDVRISGEQTLPLSPHAWLVAAEQSALECEDSVTHLRKDPAWEGLQEFHRAILPVLVRGHQEAEKLERKRLKLKAGVDKRRMVSALARLAQTLAPGLQRVVATTDTAGSPLFLASRMVGEALGIDIKPPAQSPRLASKDPLRDIARASGIRTRRVMLRGSWWRDDAGPLLGFLTEGNTPVALLPVNGTYEMRDPVAGTGVAMNRDLSFALEPSGCVFYRPFPNKRLTARDLMDFGLPGCRSELKLVLLTGIAGGLLGLAIPIFTGMVFDTIIPSAQRRQLIQISLLLVAGALATGMFNVTRSLALLRLEGRMGATLQAAVWDRLLSLPVPFFRQYSAGDLADRANGIDVIRQSLTGTVTNSIVSGIFSIFNLGLMLYYSWKLALVGLGLVILALLVMAMVGAAQLSPSRELARAAGKLSGQVMEFVSGAAKFRAAGAEGRAFAAWTRGYSRQKQLVWKTHSISNGFSVFNSVYFVLAPMSIFFAVYYWSGRIGAGDFLAFNSAFGQLFGSSMALASAVLQIYTFLPVFERAKPILTTAPEVDTAKADPGELAGDVEAAHLAFRYSEDGPLVLKDVSLKINAGEFVAIVGPSGCGKSTLFRLLLGFEGAEAGSIFYDGQDLKGLDLNSVRRQIGVVLQNSTLFRGDIFANIVGSKPLTLDDAWTAARLAGLDNDLRQMPMGMHTVITDGGGGLSGGQRQRLMIARAIVSKPRILLFDEATSALDNNTQAVVSRSLEGLKATRIVIAHRLSTVQNADRIYVFDQGNVVQSGTFAELIQQDGLFAALAKRQLT